MSIFASLTTATIPIPFDAGQTVTLRKLTGREIEAAQEAHRATLASGSAKSWAATFRRALEKGATDPDVLKAIRDPLTGYDRYALVRSGLVAWSYPLPIQRTQTTATGTTVVSVVDAVDDLDDEAVDWIAREVLRLTKPTLFHATAAEAVEEKKEDLELSTVT